MSGVKFWLQISKKYGWITAVAVGNTYQIKEELKKLGFRWDPAARQWFKGLSRVPPKERVSLVERMHRLGQVILFDERDILKIKDEGKRITAFCSFHNFNPRKPSETLPNYNILKEFEIKNLEKIKHKLINFKLK